MTEPTQKPGVNILLVDDDQIILDSLGGFLRLEGYDVTGVSSVVAAMDHLKASQFSLVISDVSMPVGDGFELLRYIRAQHPSTVVILLTGYGTIESAVEAIKQGAYDYLTKPVIDDDVRLAVQRALQQQHLLAENRQLKAALAGRYSFDNIVGADSRMAKVFDLIAAVSEGRTTVLITGESGTGKSMIARAIHAHSQRRGGPLWRSRAPRCPTRCWRASFSATSRAHSLTPRQTARASSPPPTAGRSSSTRSPPPRRNSRPSCSACSRSGSSSRWAVTRPPRSTSA